MTIDDAMRREAIDGALAALNEAYVFPDVARQMEAAIRARQRRGENVPSRAGGSLRSCSPTTCAR